MHAFILFIMLYKLFSFKSERSFKKDISFLVILLLVYLSIHLATGGQNLKSFPINRLIIEVFLTVVLISIKDYSDISIIWLGMIFFSKFITMKLIDNRKKFRFYEIIDYILLFQFINVLLVLINKYGIFRFNLSGYVNRGPISQKPV